MKKFVLFGLGAVMGAGVMYLWSHRQQTRQTALIRELTYTLERTVQPLEDAQAKLNVYAKQEQQMQDSYAKNHAEHLAYRQQNPRSTQNHIKSALYAAVLDSQLREEMGDDYVDDL